MNNNELVRRSVKFVMDYERKHGRNPAPKGKGSKGFDIWSNPRKIEVKGTRKKQAIPDLFETEFTKDKKLVATHLYVVSFANPKKPQLFIIPRKAIKPEYVKTKIGWRISSTFKNKLMGKYKVKA